MKIDDYDYKLETKKGNYAEVETEIIEGRLLALIIETNKKCEIAISFSEIDVVIYHNMEFYGVKYLPINLQTLTPNNQLLLSGSCSFHFNNKVKIKVSGQIDTEVEVTLRMT